MYLIDFVWAIMIKIDIYVIVIYLYRIVFISFIVFFSIFQSANILQPTNNILMPQSTAQVENTMQSKPTTLANVGQTWSNASLNIDLDNLMATKSKSAGASLSMNQLKLQSPVKQQQSPVPPMMSPQPPLHINNNAVNNNFNSLNNNFGANNMFSPSQQPNILSGNVQQATNQQPFFGNLMATVNPNANNLNNQFNAFQ